MIQIKKEQITVDTFTTETNEKAISFTASPGSFGYVCHSFSSFFPNRLEPEFSVIKYKYPYGSITIQMANIQDSKQKSIDISQPDSLKIMTQIQSIYVDWKGVEALMPKYELSLDSADVTKFISQCRSDYQVDKKKHLDMLQAEQQKIEQHKKDIKKLITEKLKLHGLKKITNGGEIELGETVVGKKYSRPQQYRQFLREHNIAYYMDFSDYIITQELSTSSYMLQHVADYYGSFGGVNTFPIIFHSKQKHYEQEYLSQRVVIYQGIKSYRNIYGQRKQAIFISEL